MMKRKGTAGEEGIGTVAKMLLVIAAVGIMAAIAWGFVGAGNMPQLSIIQDFSGGMVG